MHFKLDELHIELIKGLVSTQIRFYKSLFSIKNSKVREETRNNFSSVSPMFELIEALKLHYEEDEDFMRDCLADAVTGRITEEECVKRIIANYNDLDRILAREQWDDWVSEDMYNDWMHEKELRITIIYTDENMWEVLATYDGNYLMEELCKNGFETKEAAVNYAVQLNDEYNVISISS